MKHPQARTWSIWPLAALSMILSLCGWQAVQAQTAVADRSPAQALACLQRPDRPPQFPARHLRKQGQDSGFIRVLLHFHTPDQPPRIELLANTASESMQDQVYRFLSWYRLPCLQPGDGVVQAVQEFSFHNSPTDPSPFENEQPNGAGPSDCLVTPRKALSPWSVGSRLSHVLVHGRFAADGASGPELKVLHSNASREHQQMVLDHMAQYRMPCRAAADKPYSFEQQFSFSPHSDDKPWQSHRQLALSEFLGLLQNRQQLAAYFDFNTMACPFLLGYSVRQPSLPNAVRQQGKPNPSRLPLMTWLAAQRLAIDDERQLNRMFGATLTIKVDCGLLDLKPASEAD